MVSDWLAAGSQVMSGLKMFLRWHGFQYVHSLIMQSLELMPSDHVDVQQE